jgi:uncharacterized protein YneR
MYEVSLYTSKQNSILVLKEKIHGYHGTKETVSFSVKKNDIWYRNFQNFNEAVNFIETGKANMYVRELSESELSWMNNHYLPKAKNVDRSFESYVK